MSTSPQPRSVQTPTASQTSQPRILISGDSAVTVEFGATISAELNARVIGLDRALTASAFEGFIESVPTYRSLIVHYDPTVITFGALSKHLLALAAETGAAPPSTRRWRLPIVYGGEHGVDLDAVARSAGLSADEVISIHSGALYRVYMVGFTPGYSYLGGLDARIATPRLTSPRLMTPAGTVGIGGEQTGVQCLAGPSGWNLIGSTPVRTFHPMREPMFLLEPGDSLSFDPVPTRDWEALDRAAAKGEILAELTVS